MKAPNLRGVENFYSIIGVKKGLDDLIILCYGISKGLERHSRLSKGLGLHSRPA